MGEPRQPTQHLVLLTMLAVFAGGCSAHAPGPASQTHPAGGGGVLERAVAERVAPAALESTTPVALPAADGAAEPDDLPAPPALRATGEGRLAPVLARLLVAEGVRLDQLADVQVIAANLGGVPVGDQVVAAELFADRRHLASALWILGGSGDARRVLAAQSWPASSAEDGFYDDPAGIRELAGARMVWPDRGVPRVSLGQQPGGVGPRYRTDTVYLLALDGDRVATLFACARTEDNESGPARAGVAIARDIRFTGPLPQDVRVSRQVTYDPGVLDDHEAELDERARGITAGSPRPTTARYRFVHGRYQPTGPSVCQPY